MTPGNGEVEFRVPALGAVRITGRDLMLAATLAVLGAAAITVQVVTLRSFADGVRAEVRRASDERARMLGLLTLRTCTTEYLEAARSAYPPAARQDVARLWGEVCLSTSRGGPTP
jgi:hypothetical protein